MIVFFSFFLFFPFSLFLFSTSIYVSNFPPSMIDTGYKSNPASVPHQPLSLTRGSRVATANRYTRTGPRPANQIALAQTICDHHTRFHFQQCAIANSSVAKHSRTYSTSLRTYLPSTEIEKLRALNISVKTSWFKLSPDQRLLLRPLRDTRQEINSTLPCSCPFIIRSKIGPFKDPEKYLFGGVSGGATNTTL
ncbi:hypothetical protein M426DRAFT_140242 [Hypoxylon sp. CI-4A]|nr:hypothetical protein M426DRAFT_140242 [Hypoxylon sp. CI-4A]